MDLRNLSIRELDALLKAPHVGERLKERIREYRAGLLRPVGTSESSTSIEGTKPATDPAEPLMVVVPWDKLASKNLLERGGGDRKAAEMRFRQAIQATRAYLFGRVDPPHPRFRGDVAVELVYYPPDRRRRDCHNLDAALFDGIQGAIVAGDHQVVEWHGRKADPDPRSPRVEITLRRYERRVA